MSDWQVRYVAFCLRFTIISFLVVGILITLAALANVAFRLGWPFEAADIPWGLLFLFASGPVYLALILFRTANRGRGL